MVGGRRSWPCKPTWPSVKICSAAAALAKTGLHSVLQPLRRALRGLPTEGQPWVPRSARSYGAGPPLRRTARPFASCAQRLREADAPFVRRHATHRCRRTKIWQIRCNRRRTLCAVRGVPSSGCGSQCRPGSPRGRRGSAACKPQHSACRWLRATSHTELGSGFASCAALARFA